MGEEYNFEISFYEDLDKRDSNDVRVMEILAQLYTKVGRNAEGLSMDLRLSKARPEDPMIHYNLSCSLALMGQLGEAVEVLMSAIEMGYSDFDWMMQDKDLDPIRNHPAYKELLNEIGREPS